MRRSCTRHWTSSASDETLGGIRLRAPRDLAGKAASPESATRLALPSAIGNRAMVRLLQRRPPGTDVIKSLGAQADPKDYKQTRTGGIPPLYADVAALAQAGKMRDVAGTAEKDVTAVDNATVGKKNVKPGLNLVRNLSGKGETGFVDADGIYRGSRLPVTLDGQLPKIAIMLAHEAFNHGKDSAVATMRHEMEHAGHLQLLVDQLDKWRKAVKAKSASATLTDAAARTAFDKWVAAQTGISKVDRALIAADKDATGNTAKAAWDRATEILAYAEGFMTTMHLGAQQPSLKLAIDYPGAIEQLHGLAKRWGSADKDIRTATLERLRDYYEKVLDDTQRKGFRDWLWFLVDFASETPEGLTGDDLRAARKIANDFKAYRDFLRELLTIARKFEFAANKPADLGNKKPVEIKKAGAALTKKPVKVAGGEVELRKDVDYKITFSETTPSGGTISDVQERAGGVSLQYKGSDTQNTRWLQFIWREVVAEFPDGTKVAQPGSLTHSGQSYELTRDRNKRSYNTDTATKKSAFYEQDNSVNRSAGELTAFDLPDPRDDFATKPFKEAKKPKQVVSTAHLVDYLVRGDEVLFRAEIDINWTYATETDKPKPVTTLQSAGKADQLDPAMRRKLREQFPKVDYLP
jgi:hypothetical protein